MREPLLLSLAVGALTLCSCGGRSSALSDPFPQAPRTIQVQSTAFAEGGAIPRKYSGEGEDVSPPLTWSGVPPAAKSLALICEDPDAPLGIFCHWIVLDLSPEDTGLPESLPKQPVLAVGDWAKRSLPPRQGTNDFDKPGYGGPKPPSGTHRYVFRLFALDDHVSLGPKASRNAVMRSLAGHVLAQGRLVATYTRSR